MNDLLYRFELICQRRGVTLSNVESVLFNVLITFGLGNKDILPGQVNKFFYLDKLTLAYGANMAGVPLISISPNAALGSLGSVLIAAPSNVNTFTWQGLEVESLSYFVGSHTAGSFVLTGTVFKITYA